MRLLHSRIKQCNGEAVYDQNNSEVEERIINVEIDLLPCNKCDQWHRDLFWHDKYDDYLLNRREEWKECKRKRPNLFKDAIYVDSLPAYGLKEHEQQEACYICGCMTHFASTMTRHYICSKECKNADENAI